MKIKLLDASVANKIAAGEVVERPASIVKELVENSIDAGASSVTVEIRGGGIDLIRISDNGCGMEEDDVKQAFLTCHQQDFPRGRFKRYQYLGISG